MNSIPGYVWSDLASEGYHHCGGENEIELGYGHGTEPGYGIAMKVSHKLCPMARLCPIINTIGSNIVISNHISGKKVMSSKKTYYPIDR